jgi:hypothetical protein
MVLTPGNIRTEGAFATVKNSETESSRTGSLASEVGMTLTAVGCNCEVN